MGIAGLVPINVKRGLMCVWACAHSFDGGLFWDVLPSGSPRSKFDLGSSSPTNPTQALTEEVQGLSGEE